MVSGFRIVARVAVPATLLLAGCTSGSTTVTGTLGGADGACLYLEVPTANGTDRYWLRQLPPDYGTDDEPGVVKPDGSRIGIGISLTVSGTLSWAPFERNCAGAHTLDATAIE